MARFRLQIYTETATRITTNTTNSSLSASNVTGSNNVNHSNSKCSKYALSMTCTPCSIPFTAFSSESKLEQISKKFMRSSVRTRVLHIKQLIVKLLKIDSSAQVMMSLPFTLKSGHRNWFLVVFIGVTDRNIVLWRATR